MKTISAEQVLEIKNPKDLFTINNIKSEYHQYVKIFHPDRNPGDKKAEEAFKKITELYRLAQERIDAGIFEDFTTNLVTFVGLDKKEYKIRYKIAHLFELGTMYIGSTIVAYYIQPKFEKLAKNAIRKLENLKFANEKMKKQFETYLPKPIKTINTNDGMLIVFKKKEDELLLNDVLAKLGNTIDPRHVAWMMSSIYNISCFLEYNKIVHNAISLNSIFISPSGHYGLLMGWWYATEVSKPLLGLPKQTINKTKAIRDDAKIAKFTTDLELIRALGRDLLCDSVGNKLLTNKRIPKPLATWLTCSTSNNSAVDEYSKWNSVIMNSWGKREFIEFAVTEQTIYG